MPAVEHRARDHEPQGPEGPVQVGVDQGRREEVERIDDQQSQGRAAQQQGHHPGQGLVEDVVDRMDPPRGRPVQLLGAVVDGVERPEPLGVEGPVRPVLDHVDHEDHQPGLHRHRQVRDPAAAGLDLQEQPLALGPEQAQQHEPRHRDGQIGEEDEGQQPEDQVAAHVPAEPARLARIARPAPAQQREGQEGHQGEDHRPEHEAASLGRPAERGVKASSAN